MNPRKVMILGLDGATWQVINRLMSEDMLPTLQKIVKKGTSGPLTTVVPPLTYPAWVSSVTGVNPGKHNIYDFVSHLNYKTSFVNVSSMKAQPIWRVVSRKGLRYIVINVPVTFPPDKNDNGVMISGMDAPSERDQYAYPSSVKTSADVIGYRIDCGGPTNFRNDPNDYLDAVLQTIDRREKIALDLMRSFAWNFFMMVETASDRVQHFYWKYFDSNYPNYNHSFHSSQFNIIPTVYQRLDTMLDRLISANQDANVLIISDHGFGPRIRDVYLNNRLISAGLLSMKKLKVRSSFRKAVLFGASIATKMRIPLDSLIRFSPSSLVNPFLLGGEFSLEDVNWSKTKAIFLSYTGRSFLVNLKGREPNGIVDQNDYNKIRDNIIQNLNELEDPLTGKKVVKRFYKREEVYKGDFVSAAPDILVQMDEGYCAKDGLGEEVFAAPKAVIRNETGDHQPVGIFLAYGPDIAQGRIIDDASILDIVPTALLLMRQEIPSSVDGKALVHILRNPSEFELIIGSAEETMTEKQRIKLKLNRLRMQNLERSMI